MVRTMQIYLQPRLHRTLEVTRRVIRWTVELRADLTSKLQVGQDGWTGVERRKKGNNIAATGCQCTVLEC